MGVQLGSAFLGPVVTPRVITEDDRHAELLAELVALRAELVALLRDLPVPQVNIPATDLAPVLAAVDGITLPAPVRVEPLDYERLAAVLTRALREEDDGKGELAKALERINKKIGALAGSGGSGSGGIVTTRADNPLHTTEVRQDTRYDWQNQGGTSVPLYIATADPGTTTATPQWRVEKYTYITGPAGDPVPSLVQTAVGAWDNRATLF